MKNKFKKFVNFIEVLNSGQEIMVDEQRIVLGYTDEDVPVISMVFEQYKNGLNGDSEEILLEPPMLQDFNNFIDYVNNHVNDEELENGLLNLALNGVLKKRK